MLLNWGNVEDYPQEDLRQFYSLLSREDKIFGESYAKYSAFTCACRVKWLRVGEEEEGVEIDYLLYLEIESGFKESWWKWLVCKFWGWLKWNLR